MERFRNLRLGCTTKRHAELGVHAVINAKSGRADLNQPDHTSESSRIVRDAERIRAIGRRVRVYQFESRWFKKRFSHLLSDRLE